MSDAIPFEQQAAIYGLLGRVFIAELDHQCLVVLQEPDILTVFEKLHAGFRDYVENTPWDEERLERLASDYCHLFVLPQKSSLSLQASHWVAGEESSDIAQIEALIDSLEVDLSALSTHVNNIPNDHLGILLYFMGAIYTSDDPDVQRLGPQLAKLAFYPWIFRFADKLSTATNNPIYLASSKLLLELLEY